MSGFETKVAGHIAELYKVQEALEKDANSARRTGRYPTTTAIGFDRKHELVRIAAVDLEEWSVLVQPSIITYDGSVFVMHQNPASPSYRAYLPDSAPHPLVGDCGLSTNHGETTVDTLGNPESIHTVFPISAGNIPAVVLSRLGHLILRADTTTASYSHPMLSSLGVHGPQVYTMRAYPRGIDLQDEYVDVPAIQLNLAVRDVIPSGTVVLLSRGPITRAGYSVLSGSLTVLSTHTVSTGMYMQVPVWV